ncbi:hypothetical protein ACTI_46910 [Actinoplanes sp. OR16]|nr:hypothetical protein ACTI_46910 [Actinoplanes sp. OR16]
MSEATFGRDAPVTQLVDGTVARAVTVGAVAAAATATIAGWSPGGGDGRSLVVASRQTIAATAKPTRPYRNSIRSSEMVMVMC